MFLLGQFLRAGRLRIDALRQLYRQSLAEKVVGCDSGRRYRIYCGSAMNVYEMDHAGCLYVGRCFMPVGNLVAGDVMLAQKIALETTSAARQR